MVAVQLANEIKLSHVIFEGDSQTVINNLASANSQAVITDEAAGDTTPVSSHKVEEIISSCNHFVDFRFCWCEQSCNQYARDIVKWAANTNDPIPLFVKTALRPMFSI
ncbi:hypothetical protein ACHQM5_006522 [Ranunculus cassubicifolius]